jgi:hypothetical protein
LKFTVLKFTVLNARRLNLLYSIICAELTRSAPYLASKAHGNTLTQHR